LRFTPLRFLIQLRRKEANMGFDQIGSVVFRVVHGADSRWDVNEEGFDKPLASFDTQELATKYANDIARTKEGSRVILGDTPPR
jgi:hypothetical protein